MEKRYEDTEEYRKFLRELIRVHTDDMVYELGLMLMEVEYEVEFTEGCREN